MTIEPYQLRHRDGTVWARGQKRDGVASGFWEWFRKDGTKLRSGHFDDGVQTGAWTTYDKAGKPYKTTMMRAGRPARRKAAR